MKKLFKLTLILAFFNACVAQKVKEDRDCINITEIQNFIKAEIDELSNLNYIIDSKIIEETSSKEPLIFFLRKEAFELVSKTNIKSKKDIIDFKTFFTKEDFEYMKCQLKQNKMSDWQQLVKKEYFKKNDSIKNLIARHQTLKDLYKVKNYQEILNLKKSYFYYSIPLLSKDREHAIIYRETSSSGSLFILKKIKNKWTYFATGLVWSSD